MCVYVCMCVYMCVYVCVYVCICVYMYAYVCICVHMCAYMCVYKKIKFENIKVRKSLFSLLNLRILKIVETTKGG
jgi:hypothetical protein